MDESEILTIHDPRFALDNDRGKPDFLLVGGMKCGTTSFAKYLSAHPQISLSGPKEPNYWSWHRYPLKYQDFFVNKHSFDTPSLEQFISGEFSTSYLLHPMVPRRVRSYLPGVKIFIFLRNPVDRAFSHFMMVKRAGGESECSFKEIVKKEIKEIPDLLAAHERGFRDISGKTRSCYTDINDIPLSISDHKKGSLKNEIYDDIALRDFYYKSYVFRSIYYDQVRRWLTMFPKEQVMIVKSESFFDDAVDTMSRAIDFLGLNYYDFKESDYLLRSWDAGASNSEQMPENYKKLDSYTRSLLLEFFNSYNQKLYDYIGEDFGWT